MNTNSHEGQARREASSLQKVAKVAKAAKEQEKTERTEGVTEGR